MTEGATPSNESDEDGRASRPLPSPPPARVSVRESEKVDGGGVPISGEGRHDGDQSPAHARRAWERALMPRQSPGPSPSLSFSFRAAASVSLVPRLPPARALSFLQRSPSLSLPLSRSLPKGVRATLSYPPPPAAGTHQGEDRRPRARDPRPFGRALLLVQGCSVSG